MRGATYAHTGHITSNNKKAVLCLTLWLMNVSACSNAGVFAGMLGLYFKNWPTAMSLHMLVATLSTRLPPVLSLHVVCRSYYPRLALAMEEKNQQLVRVCTWHPRYRHVAFASSRKFPVKNMTVGRTMSSHKFVHAPMFLLSLVDVG